MAANFRSWRLPLLLLLVLVTPGALSKPQQPGPPPPEKTPYTLVWTIAARTANDPAGNSSAPGACRRLIGAPVQETLRRTQCKSDVVHSWVPPLKAPRYVDVRFEVKATILASRVTGVQVQLLNLGTLKPPIKSIDFVLSVEGVEGATPVTMYTGRSRDTFACPGITVFPIPADLLSKPVDGLSLEGATVLGLRVYVNDDAVPRKLLLPSISAVGLQVLV